MEVSGIAFRPVVPSLIGKGIEGAVQNTNHRLVSLQLPGVSRVKEGGGSRRRRTTTISKLFASNSGFFDAGHVQYYCGSTPGIRCASGKKEKPKAEVGKKMKKELKNRLQLIEGLSRDLSMFSDLGFGLDPPDHHEDNHGLVDQVKGKMMSDATELLLGQLQRLRAEEEELKRDRKEEKAKLKAAQMQKRLECELSSGSSSSSESSDSECGEVVDMSCLKSQALAQPQEDELQSVMQEATLQLPNTLTQEENTTELQSVIQEANAMLTTPSKMNRNGKTKEEGVIIGCSSQIIEQQCCTARTNAASYAGMAGGGGVGVGGASSGIKFEVCMGGKCKKSGAAALLEEFQRVLGAEGSVVGCKCMGKCRDGPNVRVLNCSDGVQAECVDDSVRVPTSPLYIGVGFEDVGLIVANFFGEKEGLAAAS